MFFPKKSKIYIVDHKQPCQLWHPLLFSQLTNVPHNYNDVLFRRWVVHYFCMNIKKCWVCNLTFVQTSPQPPPSPRPHYSKHLLFQNKDMKAEVEIGQLRSAGQFAVDTLNPWRMTTLAFFRVVRRMIEVRKKRNLCPEYRISARACV